jgi:hypothetical protein
MPRGTSYACSRWGRLVHAVNHWLLVPYDIGQQLSWA